jgi:hypothetical protein
VFWRKRDTLSLLFRPYLGTLELRARFEPTLLCASVKTVEVADPVSWFMIRAGWKVVAADGSEVGEVDEVAGDDTEPATTAEIEPDRRWLPTYPSSKGRCSRQPSVMSAR